MVKRGREREKSLKKTMYVSSGYMSEIQWNSFLFQIRTIYDCARIDRRDKVLEIGVGGRYVACILEECGFDLTTVDINENLKPDYVLDISSGDGLKAIKGTFDFILCAEVLEHIPLQMFDRCLLAIKEKASGTVLITLPNCRKHLQIGAEIQGKRKGIVIELPFKKKLFEGHFWELNSSPETTIKAIRKRMSKYFDILKEGVVPGNFNHYYFMLQIHAPIL